MYNNSVFAIEDGVKIVISIGTFLSSFNPIPPGGGGGARTPLGIICRHSVGDAPTNPKFLDFFNCQIFFRPKKERFFDKNGQNYFFLTNMDFFVSNM
jgi:hypothetical protein